MGRGTLHDVTSGGQTALSIIASAAHGGGKEDFEEMHTFPTVICKGKMQEEA